MVDEPPCLLLDLNFPILEPRNQRKEGFCGSDIVTRPNISQFQSLKIDESAGFEAQRGWNFQSGHSDKRVYAGRIRISKLLYIFCLSNEEAVVYQANPFFPKQFDLYYVVRSDIRRGR